MPGFGPAAEALLFWQKDPKPLTPRPASLHETDARYRRADQLASLTQGPPAHESVNPEGLAAGVGQIEKEGEGRISGDANRVERKAPDFPKGIRLDVIGSFWPNSQNLGS